MDKKKRNLAIGIGVLILLGVLAYFFVPRPAPQTTTTPVAPVAPVTPPETPPTATTPETVGGNMLEIQTQYGPIEIELYPTDAPKTVTRIKELVQKGFYNGLTFHRVVPGFVVQGGDPQGNGTGGSGQKLPAEFNSRKHVEGTLAMARASDPNSADSQFYICLATVPHLDNNYTVFGQVTKGMDAVKQIKVGDKMEKVSLK